MVAAVPSIERTHLPSSHASEHEIVTFLKNVNIDPLFPDYFDDFMRTLVSFLVTTIKSWSAPSGFTDLRRGWKCVYGVQRDEQTPSTCQNNLGSRMLRIAARSVVWASRACFVWADGQVGTIFYQIVDLALFQCDCKVWRPSLDS